LILNESQWSSLLAIGSVPRRNQNLGLLDLVNNASFRQIDGWTLKVPNSLSSTMGYEEIDYNNHIQLRSVQCLAHARDSQDSQVVTIGHQKQRLAKTMTTKITLALGTSIPMRKTATLQSWRYPVNKNSMP
jgi:hypothetical protein